MVEISQKHAFTRADIDRALVMTRHNLVAFSQSEAGGAGHMTGPERLDATVGTLLALCCGQGEDGREPTYPLYEYSSSEYTVACRACVLLNDACSEDQRSLLKELIEEVLKQHQAFAVQVLLGQHEATEYDMPLTPDNRFGRALLALANAFGVPAQAEFEPAK